MKRSSFAVIETHSESPLLPRDEIPILDRETRTIGLNDMQRLQVLPGRRALQVRMVLILSQVRHGTLASGVVLEAVFFPARTERLDSHHLLLVQIEDWRKG